MRDHRVPVPARVLEGLEAVRVSGETNMFDIPVVAILASKMGYRETAQWVREHRRLYAEGVLKGFRPTVAPWNSARETTESNPMKREDAKCADN